MPEPSIPADDNADAVVPAPDAADNGTVPNEDNNPDASKSDDTVVADDDKSKETPDNADDAPALQLDDDLDDWITKRGAKVPETDEEKKVFQDLRNEQREFHNERQSKKDAEDLAKAQADAKKDIPKTDDEDEELDEDDARIKKIEDDLASERTTRQQSEFYTSNKVTPEEHKAILDIYKEKVNKPESLEGRKRAVDVWSTPDALPDLLSLAKARLATSAQSTVAEEAARAERERIARESNASSPSRSAKSTQTSDKTEDEARLERFKARYNK